MITSAQMKRLEALEAAARVRQVEERLTHDLAALRPRMVEIAEEFDMSVDDVLEHMREAAFRIAEIGDEAYEAEMAAELGMTVDELRTFDHEAAAARYAEWKEWDRARRAEVIVWHGGNPPIPYRNGEIVRDANGEPCGR